MKILITPPDGYAASPFGNPYLGINGHHYYKASETPVEIYTEAGVQQEAWQKTVVNGRPPVCPSVADIIFFGNQDGINFITYLGAKFATGNARIDNVCRYILDKLNYVFNNSNPNVKRGICVMVMPEVSAPAQILAAAPAQASITLDGFIRLADGSIFQGLTVDQAQKNRAYSLITACVMRLYLVGIIDFDLHENNFILYVDQNGILQGKIIDLGNSIIFTNGTNNFIVDPNDIILLKLGVDTYKHDIIEDAGNDTFIRKEEIVVDLLDMIKEFDTKGNLQVFPNVTRFAGADDHDNCQMGWWQGIKDKKATHLVDYDYIINNAYDLARNGVMVNVGSRNAGVSRTTIKEYIRQGKIARFDGTPPPPVAWLLAAAQAQGAQGQGAHQAQGFPAQGFPAQGQGPQGQGPQGQGPPQAQGQGQDPNDMDFNIGGGARKKTNKKRKFRKNKTKRLALRKTKSKKRRRTSKK
jgi:hypothetical protein